MVERFVPQSSGVWNALRARAGHCGMHAPGDGLVALLRAGLEHFTSDGLLLGRRDELDLDARFRRGVSVFGQAFQHQVECLHHGDWHQGAPENRSVEGRPRRLVAGETELVEVRYSSARSGVRPAQSFRLAEKRCSGRGVLFSPASGPIDLAHPFPVDLAHPFPEPGLHAPCGPAAVVAS